ncbi:MAG TPA: ABC transporter permease subunit, partial [Rubricoccaceae bacterium]
EPVRLGRLAAPALVGVVAVALVAVGLPLATMAFWLGRGTPQWAGVGAAFWDSVSAAGPAALIAAALAVPVAVVGVRRPGGISVGASRAVERAAYLGYATPPLAFALALVVFAVRAVPWAYQTLGLLVAAYALHFLAEAIGPVRSALHQAPVSAEWAARSLGRSPVRAFWEATAPQLRGGLAAAVAFVFLSALKELPIAFLLSPLGFRSLAMGVWGAAGEALYAVAAPYALVIVACAGGLVALVLRRDGR